MLSHDIAVRAFKTFVQAFLASVAVAVVNVHDITTAKAALIAAVAAGVSAVWNFVVATR